MSITGEQVRRARNILGWSRVDLARKAHLSETTIRNCENGTRPVKSSSVMAILAALEQAGVEFLTENGGGAGARLKKPTDNR
jgi:ribosome-binding protein aMBF1 (putative translation factor)